VVTRDNNEQKIAIRKVYLRAKKLKTNWIPITDKELEYFYNWWPVDTIFTFCPKRDIDSIPTI
jgi:hypothetical protein